MWRRAHAALAEASVAVSAELAAWAAHAAPMPDDVADRISAALATADPAATPTSRAAAPAQRAAPVGRPVARTPSRRRARRAPAAGGGRGVAALGELGQAGRGGGRSAGRVRLRRERPAAVQPGQRQPARPAPPRARCAGGRRAGRRRPARGQQRPRTRVRATGIDYRRQTVLDDARKARTQWSRDVMRTGSLAELLGTAREPDRSAGAPEALDTVVNPALRRLTASAALADCLPGDPDTASAAGGPGRAGRLRPVQGTRARRRSSPTVRRARWVWAAGRTAGCPGRCRHPALRADRVSRG